MTKKENKYKIILLFLSVFSFFPNLWVRNVDLMEARNFITAREMVVDNHWLITTLNGNLRFEKPPFPTWLTALTIKLTGNLTDEWILRIPVALVGILLVFLVYYFIRTITKDPFHGFITSFITLSTFMLIKVSNENNWDIYCYVFAMGVLTFWTMGMEYRQRKFFVIAGVFLAMSILSKGPVGIYGLVIPFVIAYFFIYGLDSIRENKKNILLSILIGIVLSAIWPIYILWEHKDVFLQVMEKEKNTWSSRHMRRFLYYMDYFVYVGIWVFFSIAVLKKNWSIKRVKNKKNFNFLFLWHILIIIFLSIIRMKKKRYGIPIYITSSMLVASLCNYYFSKSFYSLEKSDKILIKIQYILLHIISIGIPVVLIIAKILNNSISLIYILCVTGLLIPFYIFLYKGRDKNNRIKYTIIGSGVLLLLANNSLNWFVEHKIKNQNTIEYQSIKYSSEFIGNLSIYSDNFYIEDSWYVGKKVKELPHAAKENEFIYLTRDSQLGDILGNYDIVKSETFVNENKLVYLFHLKSKGVL